MKNSFNIPGSDTPALAATITALLMAMMAFPAVVSADEPEVPLPDADEREVETTRFDDGIELGQTGDQLQFEIFRFVDDTRPFWHVAAHLDGMDDDVLCRSTVPREAGQDYYEYDLKVLPGHRDNHIVLLTAEPTGEGAPLDPPTFQLLFHLSARDGAVPYSCSLVARGEHTDLDGGTRMRVETIDGESRLFRHEDTDDVDFCGVQEGEHDGYEKFDPIAGRFITTTELQLDDRHAGTLEAQLPQREISPPFTEEFFTWAASSSDIRGGPAGARVPRPLMLGDGDIATAWIDGEQELGIGEFITATINPAAPVRGLRVFPGHGESKQAFDGHGRPTRLLIAFDDGDRFVVDLPDADYDELKASGGIYVEFPEPRVSNCLSVQILDATEGDFSDDNDDERRRRGKSVAIGEITLYSTIDGDDEQKTADRLVRAIGGESSPRKREELRRLGELLSDEMVAAIGEILDDDQTDDETRVRIVPLLGELNPGPALPVLHRHFRDVAADAPDYRATQRALARHGSLAAPVLLDILGEMDQDDKKYVDTVRILGRVGSDAHLRRLIPELGEGNRMLRGERIRALSHGGVAMMPRLLSTAKAEGDTDAGLDALTTLVAIGNRHFPEDRAEVEEADDVRAIYEASSSRAHRIRAIEASGFLALTDGEEFLGKKLLKEDPDPVIRTFAAAALKRYPGEKARTHLEDALDDQSPDVRIAAVRTLSRRADSDDATAAVISYLGDPRAWPQGQHHGLHLLARAPGDDAVDAIGELVARDLTAPVVRTALRALRRAERSLEADQIRDHLAAEQTPHPVREQLVAMLGFSDSEEVTDLLISLASRDFEPFEELPQEQGDALAHRALMTLGKTRDDEAMQFLLGVAGDDEASEKDRLHALRGLAFVSDPELVEDLRDLAPQIPDDLRRSFRRTLTLIQNRMAIDEAHDEVQQLIDRLDREIERDEGAPLDELQPPGTF